MESATAGKLEFIIPRAQFNGNLKSPSEIPNVSPETLKHWEFLNSAPKSCLSFGLLGFLYLCIPEIDYPSDLTDTKGMYPSYLQRWQENNLSRDPVRPPKYSSLHCSFKVHSSIYPG